MKILELFNNYKKSGNRIERPYLIAEAGVNHEASLELAKRLIDEAYQGGADAIKFQSYKADTLASKYSPAYWDTGKENTTSQYELFKKYDRFWKKEFEMLKKHCDRTGIEFMSTPFDVESAKFLNDLVNVFKISSSDITNRPFIEYVSAFRKPIILSTGASDMDEIKRALGWIGKFGNKTALLHCVLNYPTEDRDANLGMITDLARNFSDNIIGYSDHTLPKDMKTLEVAMLAGARIIEKHFTHDKTLPGNDHYHAMDKEDLKVFKNNIERIFVILGDFTKRSLSSEAPAREKARRSLVASRRIPKGKRIEVSDITFKRPAAGISPADIDNVIDSIALRDIGNDEVLKWDMITK